MTHDDRPYSAEEVLAKAQLFDCITYQDIERMLQAHAADSGRSEIRYTFDHIVVARDYEDYFIVKVTHNSTEVWWWADQTEMPVRADLSSRQRREVLLVALGLARHDLARWGHVTG